MNEIEWSGADEILNSRNASNAAIIKKDVAGVAKYWMDDIVVISGEGTSYAGKKQLFKVWTEMFAVKVPPVFERLPEEIVMGDSKVIAWEKGTWNYKNETFRGNYAAMWRKINGVWMTQSELFVSLD